MSVGDVRVEVEAGQTAVLDCTASQGTPDPQLYWSRKVSCLYIIFLTLFIERYFSIFPSDHERFLDPYFKVIWERVKLFLCVFLIRASATKCFARSRNFKYGLTKDILSKGQKTKAISKLYTTHFVCRECFGKLLEAYIVL